MSPKYIICLGDGMADWKNATLGGKTPLEVANTPAMDFIAAQGQAGRVLTVPENLPPGSDVTNMGILGYDPNQYYTGRGPIEAAALGVDLPPNRAIFRLNLVTIQDGIMVDFTAGHISNEEGAQLLRELQHHFSPEEALFYPGVGYRNIVLLDPSYAIMTCQPPHDATDKKIVDFLPEGKFAPQLSQFVEKCRAILADSEVNAKRIQAGKPPATDVWPWSPGTMPKLPSFKSVNGIAGGIITAVDLLKGLGQLAGLETPNIEGATGFIDTNYGEKVRVAKSMLERLDFVFVHIEAPDETGHMGDPNLKVKAIEDFDQQVVTPLLALTKSQDDIRIMVLPDHPTPCELKTHSREPVPVAIYQNGITADAASGYTEELVTEGSLSYDTPWELLAYFLNPR